VGELRGTLVVGGGIVGLACALNLRRSGLDVTLLDNGPASRPASWGNAGHLAVEQVEPLASPGMLRSAPGRLFGRGGALDFRLSDADVWLPWSLQYLKACSPQAAAHGRTVLKGLLARALPAWRRLADSVGRADLVVERGHHLVWETSQSAARGREAWARADIGAARTRPLAPDLLSQLSRRSETPVAGGLTFEGTGQIADPGLALNRLSQAFAAEGGVVRTGQARRLERPGRRVRVRLADGEGLEPEQVVVAAGVGAGALMRGLGHAAPVIAERGYHIEGEAGDWGDLPPVVFEDRAMIVTRFADRLRAASFVEFGRAAAPADPRKWARLRRHAAAVGLPLGRSISHWMGARPTLPDYLPAIGASPRADNLFYAFGHQHLGLTLAALTGEAVADLAAGRRGAVDLAPLALERFEGRRSPQGHPLRQRGYS